MRIIARAVISISSTILILLTAAYFVPGFQIKHSPQSLLFVAIVFTVINFLISPILRVFFGPLILISFGLFYIVITAIILYLLDIITEDVNINGLASLLYAAVIVSILHFIVHFSMRHMRRDA